MSEPRPTLIVVAGPSASGKSTLASRLADAISCPVVSRDRIKEGMAATHGDVTGETYALRTNDVFFSTLRLLLEAGVTTVAEAAFQDHLWRPGLAPLLTIAHVRIVHCTVDAAVSRDRIAHRLACDPSRAAHHDLQLLADIDSGRANIANFTPVAIDVPSITVDTTEGYDLDAVIAFAEGAP